MDIGTIIGGGGIIVAAVSWFIMGKGQKCKKELAEAIKAVDNAIKDKKVTNEEGWNIAIELSEALAVCIPGAKDLVSDLKKAKPA